MNYLSAWSYYVSMLIMFSLISSLVREDTKQTSASIIETAMSYKFDIFFMDKYGDRFLPKEFQKWYSNMVFAHDLESFYYRGFLILKVLQLSLVVLQFCVYLVVH